MSRIIIVESPVKARKIQKYFKDGSIVRSSFGHIRDLDKKTMSIDIDESQGIFTPTYKTMPGKQKIVNGLKSSAEGREVILAADDDREGDAIAWHCGNILGIDFSKPNRIIFHEVTESAVKRSLDNIHMLNTNSVNAQQARRIIDRLVGFSLSPLLWKHIESDRKGLSAGRVQSAVLSLMKTKEKEIKEFVPEIVPQCEASFGVKGKKSWKGTFQFQQMDVDPQLLLQSFSQNRQFQVSENTISEDKVYPSPPFITTTLQRCASKKLRYPVKKTMDIAQKLFDSGKITYMRTDSMAVSSEFQAVLCKYIKETYSPEHYKPAMSKRKVKGAQEAHECIRVTNIHTELSEKYSKDEHALYNLIRENTICSHMKPALYQVQTISLTTPESKQWGNYTVTHRALQYRGYYDYYNDPTKYPLETLPSVSTVYPLLQSLWRRSESSPPQQYDESSLVKTLESTGIGRPSTYASIVGTLYGRNYTDTNTIDGTSKEIDSFALKRNDEIVKGTLTHKTPKQTRRILLTPLGYKVLDYLEQHFQNILNPQFTSQVETDLDLVSQGDKDWLTVIQNVYQSFIGTVRAQQSLPDVKQIQRQDKTLGDYEGKPILLKSGPYGPYLKYDNKNCNLKYLIKRLGKPANELTLDDVKPLILYPMKMGHLTVKGKKESLEIHLGPYGKYMKFLGRNYKIPQKESYTFKECLQIIKT